MIRIGVDVGGTFTDLVLEKRAGDATTVTVHKVPSTTHDQSEAVVRGITEICGLAGVSAGDVDFVFHGTTVATNIAIERNGADVGMLTTKGFRDILHIARHKRPHNFSLQMDLPWQSAPLVKRRNRLPITERILPPDGRVEVPIDLGEVSRAADIFAERGLDAVICCFLFSFLNGEHEQKAKEIVAARMPNAFICTSAEVVDMMREYERFSTTAMNAFVGPKTALYLGRLKKRLEDAGITAQVRIMQSNGGISTIENCSIKPITIMLSGPAGGVIGGAWIGSLSDRKNIITIDIGGTSADISVIADGQLKIKNPRDTQVDLLPVLAPMLDVTAIGAGGGSIASIDAGGLFRVGPRSAGAMPGPACYGRGGTEPTVTDAQVVLGRLDPEHFLGGDLVIDRALAVKAVEEMIARPLGISVEEAALGILKVVNSNMALAIRANSVAKGVDPRRFSLMAFGGAGPLHGTSLAEAVSASEVLIPPAPGITAAMGLLASGLQYENTRSVMVPLTDATDTDLARINSVLDGLIEETGRQLAADGIPAEKHILTRYAECRYVGQGFELRAEMPSETLTRDNLHVVADNFNMRHKLDYGHAFPEGKVALVTVRVVGTADIDRLELAPLADGGRTDPAEAKAYSRPTVFDDGIKRDTPRYERGKLKAGDMLNGPAIVIQHNSTSLVPPGYVASVATHGTLHVTQRKSS
ncbi:hydantoinase/oxoprolinase family protein [Agrobacterium rosae]|uniref:Hydantoinase/oxoprolinase family protein n=1 Tax=Agrobacterium rosae TaxID=1972867 RepID=A0AAW9FET4_9HYPH|nr:hydantoinase/oxoprolinase family protein [Agrobacterium rosae]MDX8304385.1 hydantoinase/oxoprolinase family protein [Agrobacterium rosae]